MARKRVKVPAPLGVKPKYLVGGQWKNKIFEKKGKASRTASTLSRSYIAYPPLGGWPGGMPGILTGLRSRGK